MKKPYLTAKGKLCPLGGLWYGSSWPMQGTEYLKNDLMAEKKLNNAY